MTSKKQEMLILTGLPASGKTQLANEWLLEDPEHRRRVNYDDIRLQLFGADWRFNRRDEARMKEVALAMSEAYLKHGHSLCIDNTNLSDGARKPWISLAKAHGITPEIHEVSCPIPTCIERDKARAKHEATCRTLPQTVHSGGKEQGVITAPGQPCDCSAGVRVGRAVIERMALFHGFIDWKDGDYYRHRRTKDFVICDIDGTLANGDHRQHYINAKDDGLWHKMDCPHLGKTLEHMNPELVRCPVCGGKPKKDWDAFHDAVDKDTVHKPIAQLLRDLCLLEYYIIIVSGRWIEKGCGIKTEDWLDKQGIPYHHLFMRNGGDSREDSIVKEEILELLPKERISFVLDDRDRVVKMWRKNGLTCLQVAEGAF